MNRTQRLLLRRWNDADREPYAAMNADPAVMEHFKGTQTRAESDAFVDKIEAHWEANGWGLWAVEVLGGAPFVGSVGLWPATQVLEKASIEVGWRLARRYWGNGYATEAAQEALRFGYTDVGADEIMSFTVPQNLRSIAVMERIGLVRDLDGDFDHPGVDADTFPHLVRHVLYRLDRATWERR